MKIQSTQITYQSLVELATNCPGLNYLDLTGIAIPEYWVQWAKGFNPRLRRVIGKPVPEEQAIKPPKQKRIVKKSKLPSSLVTDEEGAEALSQDQSPVQTQKKVEDDRSSDINSNNEPPTGDCGDPLPRI